MQQAESTLREGLRRLTDLGEGRQAAKIWAAYNAEVSLAKTDPTDAAESAVEVVTEALASAADRQPKVNTDFRLLLSPILQAARGVDKDLPKLLRRLAGSRGLGLRSLHTDEGRQKAYTLGLRAFCRLTGRRQYPLPKIGEVKALFRLTPFAADLREGLLQAAEARRLKGLLASAVRRPEVSLAALTDAAEDLGRAEALSEIHLGLFTDAAPSLYADLGQAARTMAAEVPAAKVAGSRTKEVVVSQWSVPRRLTRKAHCKGLGCVGLLKPESVNVVIPNLDRPRARGSEVLLGLGSQWSEEALIRIMGRQQYIEACPTL